ncbi:MAG: SRPBCC family protein [Elusimicrobia bacterium]|nr:SRPBCC family protein [Elusimicrobiota bacterium]
MPTKTQNGNQTATGTVRFHRVLKCPPERIYKAVLDPAANCKWLPPYGFTCTVHQLDAKVGGSFRMSFTNFSNGQSHSFGGKYLELKPGELIKASDKFDDPNLPGELVTTWTFKKVSVGTEVTVEQTGIPAAIPTEMCYLGWQESLAQLALLVEPNIPG